jgi:hypothetical protein
MPYDFLRTFLEAAMTRTQFVDTLDTLPKILREYPNDSTNSLLEDFDYYTYQSDLFDWEEHQIKMILQSYRREKFILCCPVCMNHRAQSIYIAVLADDIIRVRYLLGHGIDFDMRVLNSIPLCNHNSGITDSMRLFLKQVTRIWAPSRHVSNVYGCGFHAHVRILLTVSVVRPDILPLELWFLCISFIRRDC